MQKNGTEAIREFAIAKFAKDLLRCSRQLQMGYDFAHKVKEEEIKDFEELRRKYEEVKKGMNRSQGVTDACLKPFEVV